MITADHELQAHELGQAYTDFINIFYVGNFSFTWKIQCQKITAKKLKL